MSKWRPSSCKYCGKRAGDGWQISKRGLCNGCALARMAATLTAADKVVPPPAPRRRRTHTPGG